jgi:hypothetical protein
MKTYHIYAEIYDGDKLYSRFDGVIEWDGYILTEYQELKKKVFELADAPIGVLVVIKSLSLV